ncbi:MAG: SMP-30/gluconolactonase/LRE family protein [Parvularculaceae bacterium]|nr:SMP-30/gluconolactonase/LRE family protein [Parvularculaceae bacterium]
MRALVWLLGLVGLGVIVRIAWGVIPASGVFADLEPKLIDECRRVEIFPGVEDVTIDPDLNVAFISADDRRATNAGHPVPGGIYALKLDGSDGVSKVSPGMLEDFHPHGLSLWSNKEGQKRLFVVNHSIENGHRVEIFDVGFRGMLIHVDSVSFPEMTSPNDVLGVGPRSFYVTNDRAFDGGVLGAAEAYLTLPLSGLAYFDGSKGSVAAKGLSYANGVNISADGKTVYASAFLGRNIVVYDRDPETGALTERDSISVDTGPDNIEVAADGALWVAGHPKVFDFLKHVEDPAAVSPSQVIRIDPKTKHAENVLVDLNGAINASSVAAVTTDQLIVGAVFDAHVMVCPLQ